MEIKIRNLSPQVVKTLDEISIKKGYKSREEFLRRHLETITSLEQVLDLEDKYKKLLTITTNVIQKNTEVLEKIIDETLI